MPRNCVQAPTKIAASTERAEDCISGGISWIASLIATLLKPQLRQSPMVTATANASSGRDDGACATGIVLGDGFRCRRASSFPAMRTDTGDFNERTFRQEARGARRGLECFGGAAARRLPDRPAALADQKHDE